MSSNITSDFKIVSLYDLSRISAILNCILGGWFVIVRLFFMSNDRTVLDGLYANASAEHPLYVPMSNKVEFEYNVLKYANSL